MKYRELRSIFGESEEKAEAELTARLSDPSTIRFDVEFNEGHPSSMFVCMNAAVYRLLMNLEMINREIDGLVRHLPGRAVLSYTEQCLVDEIVLTNEIEGVHSSRREVSDALESLGGKKAKKGRFKGLIQAYKMLFDQRETGPQETCEDIRALYDKLVGPEIEKDDLPDGSIFRKSEVSVRDSMDREVHRGVHPEKAIYRSLSQALALFDDERFSEHPFVPIAVFHYLFGYIHPFYDGNGRLNRFLSSRGLSGVFNPFISLRLSFSVRENLSEYYRAFLSCEHPLNKGDVTPFVLVFGKITMHAMQSMRASLKERLDKLEECEIALESLCDDLNPREREFASVLIVAALFSEHGISVAELARAFDLSYPTVRPALKVLEQKGLVDSEKVGRRMHYKISFETLGISRDIVEYH